jgi:hypothetical protein
VTATTGVAHLIMAVLISDVMDILGITCGIETAPERLSFVF